MSVGVAFLVCVFLFGRVSEGLAAGFGGMAMVTFGLGTLVAPLGASGFQHVPAAALALATFLLAWRKRPGLAGLAGGAALLTEYQAGLIVAVIGCYVAADGWRALRAYLLGVIPGAMLLAAYDWAAFGAPWHLSYHYKYGTLSGEQQTGLFGIGWPHLFAIVQTLAGGSGLLVVSPVLLMAALGLVRLGRRYRLEAAVAGCVSMLFLLVEFGYFDPYGGNSPGPRFLVAALPFLGLGLAPALAWRPRITTGLAVVSVIAVTTLDLIWNLVDLGKGGGTWGELVRLLRDPDSRVLARSLTPNIASRAAGFGSASGALIVCASAAGALLFGIRSMPWQAIREQERRAPRQRSRRWAALAAAAGLCLVVTANVFSVTNYPYGNDPQAFALVVLHTALTGSSPNTNVGGEVNFTATVTDSGTVGAGNLTMTVVLPSGTRLVGPPAFTLGSGCHGTSTLTCNLGSLRPRNHGQAAIYFGLQVTRPGDQRVTVWASATGAEHSNTATFTIN
jgi:uncharacterized repeat protein (TIGR01451 family)